MDIHFYQRNVYGVSKYYPANEAAETLASIARTKTLAPEVFALAQQLGHTLHLVQDPAVQLAVPSFMTAR